MGTFYLVKASTQEVWYNVGVILCPLIILLFIWWPVAVMIGGVVLIAVLIGFFFLTVHFVGGISPGQSIFTWERTLSTAHLTKDLHALQAQAYEMFTLGPQDKSEAVGPRFLLAINATLPEQQNVPRELINGVAKKILYEYQRKTGSLKYRIGGKKPLLTAAELMRRLSDDERAAFLDYCKARSQQ